MPIDISKLSPEQLTKLAADAKKKNTSARPALAKVRKSQQALAKDAKALDAIVKANPTL